MPHFAAFHLGLHCLSKYPLLASIIPMVKYREKSENLLFRFPSALNTRIEWNVLLIIRIKSFVLKRNQRRSIFI